jgi:hypothetical protein
MSQNDIIILDLKKLTVSHMDAESNDDSVYNRKKFKTLKKAVDYAKKLQDEEGPEFGIHFL